MLIGARRAHQQPCLLLVQQLLLVQLSLDLEHLLLLVQQASSREHLRCSRAREAILLLFCGGREVHRLCCCCCCHWSPGCQAIGCRLARCPALLRPLQASWAPDQAISEPSCAKLSGRGLGASAEPIWCQKETAITSHQQAIVGISKSPRHVRGLHSETHLQAYGVALQEKVQAAKVG